VCLVQHLKPKAAVIYLMLLKGIHSFISLFSVYPYTGKTNDVEMVMIDVKVSVRITDVK